MDKCTRCRTIELTTFLDKKTGVCGHCRQKDSVPAKSATAAERSAERDLVK